MELTREAASIGIARVDSAPASSAGNALDRGALPGPMPPHAVGPMQRVPPVIRNCTTPDLLGELSPLLPANMRVLWEKKARLQADRLYWEDVRYALDVKIARLRSESLETSSWQNNSVCSNPEDGVGSPQGTRPSLADCDLDKSLRKAVPEVQVKLQAELAKCEKLKMANEVSILKAEKAAASAELARVESKAQADIQAVTAACQDRETQISCLQAKLKEADSQAAAAAAACLNKFELEKAQIEEAARRKFDIEKAQVAVEAREDAQACKICLENPHNVVIYPCSHAHYCGNCLEKHRKTQDTCPTCRAVIIGTVRYIV